ncbi:MAG: DUF5667 domain-containing protein, partial [Actinomycetota bacterium]|nr:DUF5667 domain-containing protein [Actinomycetota bacterium]
MLADRRQARSFATAVDGIGGRAQGRGGTGAGSEVPSLASLVDSIRTLPAVRPTDHFRGELRARLLMAAELEFAGGPSAASHTPGPTSGRVQRGLAAATGAVVLAGAGAGLASASASSVPGDLLYPVKRGLEQVDLTVATGSLEQGMTELDRAAARLAEAESLLDSDAGQLARLPGTFVDFSSSAAIGRDLLLQSYASSGDPAALRAMQDFVSHSSQSMTAMVPQLPAAAQAAFVDAAEQIVGTDSAIEQVCPTCAPDTASGPADLLADSTASLSGADDPAAGGTAAADPDPADSGGPGESAPVNSGEEAGGAVAGQSPASEQGPVEVSTGGGAEGGEVPSEGAGSAPAPGPSAASPPPLTATEA